MRTRIGTRRPVTAVALIAAAVITAGCGAAPAPTSAGDTATDPPAGVTAADPTAIVDPATVASFHGERTFIDVRTPGEVAAGYVDGSLLLDVQDPGFDDAVAGLPRDEAYVVYCRSGNRSGQAIERMRAMGFTDLINGGAYDDLDAAGLPTATG
jgi:phage shock protein E